MSDDPQFIITRQTRGKQLRRGTLVVLSVVLTALTMAALAWYLLPRLNDSLGQRLEQSESRVGELSASNEELMRSLVIAERESQITSSANDQLRIDLKQAEARLSDLSDDIEFYQRLLEAGGVRRGLGIHELQLENTPSGSIYGYNLTLSQNLEKAEIVNGTVQIALSGLDDGQVSEINPVTDDNTSLAFEFKYFQRLTGTLAIPEGFSPMTVKITVSPEGRRNRDDIVQQFEWDTLVSELKTNVQD